jgi:hypothetical protein
MAQRHTHMLEVELGLLSDGSIGVESRLDAVPQHGHVHGHGARAGGAGGILDISSRRALAVGAVWAAGVLRASSLPEGPQLGAAERMRGKDEERARPAIWWFRIIVHPLRFASSLCRSGGVRVWVAANVPAHTTRG